MKRAPLDPLQRLASAYLGQAFSTALTLLRLCPVLYRKTMLDGLRAGLTALCDLRPEELGDESAVAAQLARLDARLEELARQARAARRDGPSQAYPSEGP